MRSILTTV